MIKIDQANPDQTHPAKNNNSILLTRKSNWSTDLQPQ